MLCVNNSRAPLFGCWCGGRGCDCASPRRPPPFLLAFNYGRHYVLIETKLNRWDYRRSIPASSVACTPPPRPPTLRNAGAVQSRVARAAVVNIPANTRRETTLWCPVVDRRRACSPRRHDRPRHPDVQRYLLYGFIEFIITAWRIVVTIKYYYYYYYK